MTAAAIVVGIDAYLHLPKLEGSVQDALDVVDWLLDIGLQPGRIRLHLAGTKQHELRTGVVALAADRDTIWSSMRAMQQDSGGDTLYVFLSGHGYYLARSGPIFLAADWSQNASSKNLDINSYAEFLLGLQFKDVLFVVDACQNLDVDSLYVSPIRPSLPDDGSAKPNAANGLLLCCATEQEQYAPIVDGRGLLTRTLLAALRHAPMKLPQNAGDALVFDWHTGKASIDLFPLFKWSVTPDVVRQAQDHGHVQRPTMKALGRTAHEWGFTACTASVDSVPLRVTADPLQGLNTIKITMTPPARALELPLTTTPPMPFDGFAPANRRLSAICTPAEDWEADPPFRFVSKTTSDVDLPFTLRQIPPALDRDSFNIKAITAEGELAFAFGAEDYDAASLLGGLSEVDASGSPQMVPNETGLDIFQNGASLARTTRFANRVSDLLAERGSRNLHDVEVVITPPGQVWSETRPNIRFVFPPGGSREVVGLLRETPMIRVEPMGAPTADGTSSLAASAQSLEASSWRRLKPGPYRLLTEAPWGTGIATFEVGGVDRQTVVIPTPVGQAPLRNRAHDDDILLVPPQPAGPKSEHHLVYGALVHLPPNLPLLVSRADDQVRAEPYSSLPWPEWDLLIGAGRLQAVDLQAALGRLEDALEDEATALLRLALAYAAWAQDDRRALKALLAGLTGPYAESMDAQLLRLAGTPDAETSVLSGHPYLRWAYRLAQIHAPGLWDWPAPSSSSPWIVWDLNWVWPKGPELLIYDGTDADQYEATVAADPKEHA